MGVWIDAFSQYYVRSNIARFSWEEARRSRGTIREVLSRAGETINIASLNQVEDMTEYFLSQVGRERRSSFSVSNLGRMRHNQCEGDDQGWKMGRMVFSRSASAAGSAFSTGAVTGPDGCLVLGFEWQEGTVNRALLETVMGTVRSHIEEIARKQL